MCGVLGVRSVIGFILGFRAVMCGVLFARAVMGGMPGVKSSDLWYTGCQVIDGL